MICAWPKIWTISVSVSCRVNHFFIAIILMWYTRNIYIFINWTLRMSDNLPERVQILCYAHIICITVLENINICCQIFCDFGINDLRFIKCKLTTIIVKIAEHKLLNLLVFKGGKLPLQFDLCWKKKRLKSITLKYKVFLVIFLRAGFNRLIW
jgi:hypothetical protein